jgi:hypothetical protein
MPQKSKKSENRDKKNSGGIAVGGGSEAGEEIQKNNAKKILSAEQTAESVGDEESRESHEKTGRVDAVLPIGKYKRRNTVKGTTAGKKTTTKPGRVKRKGVPSKRLPEYDVFGNEIIDSGEGSASTILYNKIGSEKKNAKLAEAYREGVESRVSGFDESRDGENDVLPQGAESVIGLKRNEKNRMETDSQGTAGKRKKFYPTVAESLANETAVARLLAFGLSNAVIAGRLGLPLNAVEKIVDRMIPIQRMEHSRTIERMREDMDNQITILLAEVLEGIDASKTERVRETITVDGDGNKKIQRQIVKGRVPADLINAMRGLLERRAKLFGLDSVPDAGRVIEERNAGIRAVIDAVSGVVTDPGQLAEIVRRIENAGGADQ